MNDQDKTKQQFVEELAELRRRVAELEGGESERKRAEAALQSSEERFHKIFEEGPIGVALVSLDFRIQHVNLHFCDMLGYSENEIIAIGLAGITHPDDLQRDSHLGSSLRRGGQ